MGGSPWSILKVIPRVLVNTVQLYFIMAVNACGVACGACHSNGIAFLHGIPDIDQKGRVVRIKGSETVAMVNYNIIAKPVMVSGGNHCAARGGHYGDNAASGGDVDALVLPSVTDGGAAGGVELSRDDCAFHRVDIL